MIPLERTAAVLLCAGLSRRYGPGNKLLAFLNGKPLAMHAAELCTRTSFFSRVAVVPPAEHALHTLLLKFEFDLVVNPDPSEDKDVSLRLGLTKALDLGAPGALVLLGDMPHVTDLHLRALSDAASEETIAISMAEGIMSPPTLMAAEAARRAIMNTDRSVRMSLDRLVCVAARRSVLVDYDYAEQFDR